MRRFVLGLAMVVLLFGIQTGKSATIFNEDVTFVEGDNYWSVEIYEDAHAEVLGGLFENRLQLYDNATARLAGGDIRGIFAMQGSSKASIYPGTYINTYIFMLDTAELDIYGGRMPDRFLDATAWGGNPLITFHGSNLMLDPTGGNEGDGIVTGVFIDGSPFTVDLRGENTASCIRLVPEPTTTLLFIIGAFLGIGFWRRRSF